MTEEEVEALRRELDELLEVGQWVVREWMETPWGSSDLDQAVSVLNERVDAKGLPPRPKVVQERDEARALVRRLVNTLCFVRLEGDEELREFRELAESIRGLDWLKGDDGKETDSRADRAQQGRSE